jgi:hypothetical protein
METLLMALALLFLEICYRLILPRTGNKNQKNGKWFPKLLAEKYANLKLWAKRV